MPAIPPYLIEPIWQQFSALLPERDVSHPLGCHRPRIPDRVVFEKLVQVLVFGCAYERIADASCSATTLRDRHRVAREVLLAGDALVDGHQGVETRLLHQRQELAVLLALPAPPGDRLHLEALPEGPAEPPVQAPQDVVPPSTLRDVVPEVRAHSGRGSMRNPASEVRRTSLSTLLGE